MSDSFVATSVAAALSALGAIACDSGRRRPAFYVFKPLTTVLILAAFLLVENHHDVPLRGPMLFALLLCLAGDIALMFAGERCFIVGLAAFLLAHFLMGYALVAPLPFLRLGGLAALGLGAALAGSWRLWRPAGRLRPAVLIYVAVLTLMWLSAEARWNVLGTRSALLTLTGASLFLISDATLAWDRFIRRFGGAQALVLGTYFPALWLLACGAGF